VRPTSVQGVGVDFDFVMEAEEIQEKSVTANGKPVEYPPPHGLHVYFSTAAQACFVDSHYLQLSWIRLSAMSSFRIILKL
jgi:hypothetical protein